MKMEKSIQLSCKGEKGVSLLLGLGWAWVSSPSYFPSLCLSFLLAGWDIYAHCLSFGDPSQTSSPLVFIDRAPALISGSGHRNSVWLPSLFTHLARQGLRLLGF